MKWHLDHLIQSRSNIDPFINNHVIKSSWRVPPIVVFAAPLNLTVPVPALNVPLLVQCPATSSVVPALKTREPFVLIAMSVQVGAGDPASMVTVVPPAMITLSAGPGQLHNSRLQDHSCPDAQMCMLQILIQNFESLFFSPKYSERNKKYLFAVISLKKKLKLKRNLEEVLPGHLKKKKQLKKPRMKKGITASAAEFL